MALSITQNFNLRAQVKDFERQDLTLAKLKTTADSDYPDDYTVTIGGKIYIFNSNNSVDATLGKWREFAGGSGGGSITPGSGLASEGGKFYIRIGSGFKFGDNNSLELNCETDAITMSTGFVPIKLSTSKTLGFAIGSGLGINQSDHVFVKLGSGLQCDVNDCISPKLGSGLKFAENGSVAVDTDTIGSGASITVGSGLMEGGTGIIELGPCVVLKKFGSNIQEISQNAVIDKTIGIMKLKLATGLKVDSDGFLYIDMSELANV